MYYDLILICDYDFVPDFLLRTIVPTYASSSSLQAKSNQIKNILT